MTVTHTNPEETTQREPKSPLRQLLAVQATDIEIAQLTQTRQGLPARAACAATEAKLQQASQLQAKIKDHMDALDSEQKTTEQEIEELDRRLKESNARLYSSETTGLRAIEALQEQITGLKRRKQVAEEVVLDLISRRDSAVEKRDLVDAKHSEITQQLAQQTESLKTEEDKIDAVLKELSETRQAQILGIPQALLQDYESRRDRFGGVGVASLADQHCFGCDLNIMHPVAEVERMRQAPPDTPIDCSECGRIIVIVA